MQTHYFFCTNSKPNAGKNRGHESRNCLASDDSFSNLELWLACMCDAVFIFPKCVTLEKQVLESSNERSYKNFSSGEKKS